MKTLQKIHQFTARHPFLVNSISAITVIFIVLMTVMIICGYAPFGPHSIAVADARIQYLDFFGYLKHVLSGDGSLLYSFSKGLGGPCLALFAYYLASPLNFLVIFFRNVDLNTFFNLLFLLKSIIAAATFAIFLTYKFRSQLTTSNRRTHLFKTAIIIILSFCYGLSQYMLSQASNIMWLDGVYMLPLLMLAATCIVEGHSSFPLAILTGLTILFNWYSAGIDCIFIIIWFGFEFVMRHFTQESDRKIFDRNNISRLLRFIISLGLGVLISSVLFLPTIAAILGTSHGTPSLTAVFNPAFIGQLPSVIERYSLGAGSNYGAVSLYCGSLAIIGVVMLFRSNHLSVPIKITLGAFSALLLLTFYWQPLVMLFSLFEQVGSYWYRYSYVAIAAILFLSAYYFLSVAKRTDSRKVIQTGVTIAIVLVVIQFLRSSSDLNLTYRTAILIVCIAVGSACLLSHRSKAAYMSGIIAVFGLSICEITYEAIIFLRGYQEINTVEYASYTTDTETTVDQILQSDTDTFRISATSTRYTNEAGILGATANYNEPLAFNYLSTSTYTSTPDESQLALLNRLGYRTDFDIRTIINASIIGTDSLLGVKYILSESPINGLIYRPELAPDSASRQVYENPYALPIALVYPSNYRNIDASSVFEYQNQFYSRLLNREISLYRKIVPRLDTADSNHLYTITIPAGNYAIYGNISVTSDNPDLLLTIDDQPAIAYARSNSTSAATLTPSAFYIPSDGTKHTSVINITSAYDISVDSAEFYLLDLDLLSSVTAELRSRSSIYVNLSHSSAKFDVTALQDESLYISIPYDSGWEITNNGQPVQPEIFADALISIPLTSGQNHIEFHYRSKPLLIGAIISVIGICSTVALAYFEIKHRSML